MEVTRSKEDHPSFWNNSDYLEIGYSIYKEIWDENSKDTSTPGQQHTHTENIMSNKERVYRLLELLTASYIEYQNLTVEETCDLFHFNKIMAIFAETSNGVLHAGYLLAHDMVVIGASVCLYILKYAIFGEVVETTTMNYLKEKYQPISISGRGIIRQCHPYESSNIIY